MTWIGIGKTMWRRGGGSAAIIVNAPSGLTLTVLADDSIKIDWTDNSDNEDGFSIERSSGELWQEIDTVASDVVTFTDSGLTENHYSYRVRAYSGSTYSDYSNEVTNEIPLILYDGNTAEWDFIDISTITKDVSDDISAIADKYGNTALNLTSVEGTPHYESDGTVFNGSNESLRRAFTQPQPLCLYIVFKQITWTSNDRIFGGGIAARTEVYQYSSSPKLRAFGGSYSTDTGAQLPLDTFGIMRVVFNGANSKLQINENAAITGDFGANVPAGFTIGARGGGGASWSNIKVKDIIKRGIADGQTDDDAIYAFLVNKHNIVDGTTFDKGKVLFTFDDGMLDIYTRALPIIQSESIKATYYIVTDWVGTVGYMSWAQLQACDAAGVDLQCHTQTHTDLTTLSDAQIQAELTAVEDAFTANSLTPPIHLAYPYGSYNASVITSVSAQRTSGRLAVAGYISKSSNKYTLRSSPYGTDWADKIDLVETNKTAICFYSHTMPDDFLSIVQYAKTKNVDIITMSELIALM